jgi:hypothetical protein
MSLRFFILNLIVLLIGVPIQAQNIPALDSLPALPGRYLEVVASNASQLERKLEGKSDKALAQLKKQEEKIRRKLARIDSSKAAQFFGNAQAKYQSLENKLNGKLSSVRQYIPSLDTLTTSLKFLKQAPEFLSKLKNGRQQLENAADKVKNLQQSFQKAEEIKQFVKERKEYLRSQLQQMGFGRELKKLNKQAYYYSEQLNEYKSMLTDHKKAERKALELLSKTKLFKDFMRKHSQLASLFRLPGDPNDPVSAASLAGLQTRAQVNSLIQQQIGSGGPGAQTLVQQHMQEAQSKLNELKSKLTQLGGNRSEDLMPDGFKPNTQKVKSFWRRLEYGTNLQSQKPNGYFPVTSDIGLSVDYKINDKSMLGIGASYKIGWGQNIRNIKLSHQGAGLRSFADVKLKGSFWLSGGYEMNYRSEFNRIDVLKDLSAWQRSGLIGLSKVISLNSKFFKKTRLQLLWDFLSYDQVPRTQPVVFRVGYNFR